ncbi:hypothetical protein H845_1038 [Komagataeibacter xylinus E25]|nr:hypothetical protein H845_1038 [Komagataeibacter xylinus E25]
MVSGQLEAIERRHEASQVVPWDHVARIRHPVHDNSGQKARDLGFVLGQDDIAACRDHEVGRHRKVGNILMDILGMEAFICDAGGQFLAGMQPFGTQPELLFGPCGAEAAHRFGIHALARKADGIDIPWQAGWVGPAARGH